MHHISSTDNDMSSFKTYFAVHHSGTSSYKTLALHASSTRIAGQHKQLHDVSLTRSCKPYRSAAPSSDKAYCIVCNTSQHINRQHKQLRSVLDASHGSNDSSRSMQLQDVSRGTA